MMVPWQNHHSKDLFQFLRTGYHRGTHKDTCTGVTINKTVWSILVTAEQGHRRKDITKRQVKGDDLWSPVFRVHPVDEVTSPIHPTAAYTLTAPLCIMSQEPGNTSSPHSCPSCRHVLYMFLCIMVKYIFLFHVVCVSVSSYRLSSWTPSSKISQRDTTSSPLLLLHSYSLTQHDNLDMVNTSAVHIQHHKDHMKYNETFSTSKSLAPHESLSLLSELPA